MNIDLESGTLTLAGEWDVDRAMELRTAMLNLLACPAHSVSVDLAALTDADVVILQIFFSTTLTGRRTGKEVIFRNTPHHLTEKLELLGLRIYGLN